MTNNLQNRVLVYSVSTDSFFNDMENEVAKELMNHRVEKKELTIIKDNKKTNNKEVNEKVRIRIDVLVAQCKSESEAIESILSEISESETELSDKLNKMLSKNKDNVRLLRHDALFTHRKVKDKNGNIIDKEINKANKVVALFESSFTRVLGLDVDEVNESVVIVKAYHYSVLEDLIHNGFLYNNELYTFWSASSGQMKNKKCVFVKKSLLNQESVNAKGETYTVQERLMCGLTWDKFNNTVFIKGDKEESGVNINKYLAYLSLQNSATTKWEGFNIDKVVVCPDLEMDVTDKVEFINRDTYEISPVEEKTLPMNVSDGVGLILPELSDKNFQFRINWGKGLLSPYNFREHAKSIENYYITDVWGNKHHIIDDDVQIILSASQLKTWKYYNSMEEYRTYFKDFQCEAGKCNEEVETRDIHLNYQYLQSLDMTFGELNAIARPTNYDIHNIGSSKSVMLRSLGATVENEKKNYFQQALLMYDNILNDSHAKEMIKSKKAAMVEDALAGTLRVEGKRMFVLPDLHAYCEFLLTENKNPAGLLGKGEVFAKNINEGTVCIMRSPMLYREHGIRENTKNAELKEWFTTGALYCSNKDFLSRLLQMDFDGDQVNVSTSRQFVSVTKRNMRNIAPLYYEMSTAPIQPITEDSIYESLKSSFGSSIGSISNDITRIWNSPGEINEDKMSAIKFLTMYNNFMIDYSKTNFLPKPKGNAKKLIRKYANGDMPYFFQWAKGKEKIADKIVKDYIKVTTKKGKVYKLLKSKRVPVVNMLEDIILDTRITFKSVADKFDYRMLMNANKFESKGSALDVAIIKAYTKVNKGKKWLIDKDSDDYKENKYVYVAKVIKEELMDAARVIDQTVTDVYVADVLINYLHNEKNTGNKKTLWESFGDIIVSNLEKNLSEANECVDCGDQYRKAKNKVRCDDCQKKKDRENAKLRKRKQRKVV